MSTLNIKRYCRALTLVALTVGMPFLLDGCGGSGGGGGGGSGGGGSTPASPTLTVSPSGTGTGTVTSNDSKIVCPTLCAATYTTGTTVTLTATPGASSTFTGWSGGACSGTGTCTVSMSSAQTVTATFTATAPLRTLTVSRSGAGTGTVTSSPDSNIVCPDRCVAAYATGATVTLTATPGASSTFTGWSGGACSGTGTCTVSMSSAQTVTATFTATAPLRTLTVSRSGAGTGTVTSSPDSNIVCPDRCVADYASGTTVTLTATPGAASTFTGWSGGGCSGTGTCTVSMSSAQAVTAAFAATAATSYTLGVTVSASGAGTVTSTPSGIGNCTSSCSASYPSGTSVTLSATPTTGYTFTGWSGACTGSGSCVVAMTAAKSVTATFASGTASYTLTVGLSGSGTVTSNPAGITCGADCTQSYAANTAVTLTAAAGTGYSFSGWSGSCSGTSTTCTVTMSAARTATASFAITASTGTMELPVATQAATLFRYPFLQVADAPSSVRIVWATSSTGTSQVNYRLASGGSGTTVTANQVQYASGVTGVTTFFQQDALITGLQPGGAYVYDIIHNGTVLARNVPFVALPSSSATAVSFIAFGDSGTKYSTPRAVRDKIASKTANGDYVYAHDFVVGVGDIAYNYGSYVDYNDNFFDQMSGRGDPGNGQKSILATRPFVPALGNHDYDQTYANTPSGFLASFVLPTTGVPTTDAERYYSFDAGDAHFVVLDSMKFDTSGSSETANRLQAMLDWLDADLAATTKTWRVAFFHHTIFSVGNHGTWGDIGTNERLRKKLAPILQNRGVQLAMFGHDHMYERSKRIRVDANGKIVRSTTCNGTTSNVVESTSGIVYVVAGNGGDDLHNSQVDPTKVCGTSAYTSYVNDYGDGYDFVAMNGSTPVLFANNTSGTPTERHGFTQVSIAGSQMTISSYTYEGILLDQYTMPAH